MIWELKELELISLASRPIGPLECPTPLFGSWTMVNQFGPGSDPNPVSINLDPPIQLDFKTTPNLLNQSKQGAKAAKFTNSARQHRPSWSAKGSCDWIFTPPWQVRMEFLAASNHNLIAEWIGPKKSSALDCRNNYAWVANATMGRNPSTSQVGHRAESRFTVDCEPSAVNP